MDLVSVLTPDELLVIGVVLGVFVGLLVLVLMVYKRFRGLLGAIPMLLGNMGDIFDKTQEEFSSEGGVVSAARRGAKAMLAKMILNFLQQNPFGTVILGLLGDDGEYWIQKNPYAAWALATNPMILKGLQGGQGLIGDVVNTFLKQLTGAASQKPSTEPEKLY